MGYDERIKIIMGIFNLNQAGLAEKMNVSRSVVSEFVNGTREPSKDFIFALSKLGVSIDWFLTGKGPVNVLGRDIRDLHIEGETGGEPGPPATEESAPVTTMPNMKLVPVFSRDNIPKGAFIIPILDQRLSAGAGADLPDEDRTEALLSVPAYLSRFGRNIAALQVEGDSMEPTLRRGDLVVCDSLGWTGEGIYAIRMNGSGFVKRVTMRPGKILILSDNPAYPSIEEPGEGGEVSIIGRVHCSVRRVE